jgi:hypothetical protein
MHWHNLTLYQNRMQKKAVGFYIEGQGDLTFGVRTWSYRFN